MPSPFPGVDPYLEAPELWPGVHARLITYLGELLAAAVPDAYFVDVEERVYVLDEDDPGQRLVVPDVVVSRAPQAPPSADAGAGVGQAAPVLVLMVEREVELRERRLVIYDRAMRKPVTLLELLSPTNKLAGSRGRTQYLEKRREILHSDAHLVEVDLLRAGLRFPSREPLPNGDYFVHVSPIAMRPRGEIYAWGLRERPPVIRVPLREPEHSSLDLAQALALTYERAHYERRLDYSLPPPAPTLADTDAAWLDGLLRGQARRGP